MVLPIIVGESYVAERGKSMKAVELMRSQEIIVEIAITLKIPVSQVGLLRLTGGEEANEPGRRTHQERQRAATRAREPSSASVGKARFFHRCRRLATERRVVFSRRSRGQEGHAERDL